MARSCTPPPLSDRKRIIADAHRRRSFAPARSPDAPTDSDEVEADLFENQDAMEVDESPSAGAARGRSRRQARSTGLVGMGSSRANGRSKPPETPERDAEGLVLPTWTPLAVPSTSSNASDASEPLPPTSDSDITVQRADHSSSRQAGPLATTSTVKTRVGPKTKPHTQSPPYNPSEEFRMSLDALRWLPPSAIPSGLIAAPPGLADGDRARTNRAISGNPDTIPNPGPSHKKQRFEVSERSTPSPSNAQNNSARISDGMYATEAARSKGKGKAREISPEVPAPDLYEDVEQTEHITEESLSPEVPPPPLPGDDFEETMSVDVEILDSEPERSPPTIASGEKAGLRSRAKVKPAWLDTSRRQLKPGQRYFVGKRPPPYPTQSQRVDKGKGRRTDLQVRPL
ncbi:uncharacterized protein PHACADRAFT_178027, partial [Phanerochaete carnosa HHB-10118-sp]